MIKEMKHKHKFYGITTLGERGQAVIPAEARQAMRLIKGEKLLVFSLGDDVLIFSKLGNLEKLASHLSDKLKMINDIIKKNQ